MAVQEGIYQQDQLAQMGLDFNETTSAQQVGGAWYKLENTGDNRRQVKIVQPVGAGQGSGGFTYGNQPQAPQPFQGTPSPQEPPQQTGTTSIFSDQAQQGQQDQQAPLNLPELYKSLTESSGVGQIQAELSNKERAYNDALSKINDNPFLSEASRVGRAQKLSTDYQNSVANLQRDVVTKQADIEMQLNLQTKQFDINSQVAQQSLERFNTLLTMGALENATGEDIATITRSTGLSSSAINSAIEAKRKSDVQTQIISYDDGTNQGFAVVNAQTGEIISRQVVAQSVPKEVQTQTIAFDDGDNVGYTVINSQTGEIIKQQVTGKSAPTATEIKAGLGSGGTSSKDLNKATTAVSTALQRDVDGFAKDKYVDWKEFMRAVNAAMALGIGQEEAQSITLQQMKVLGKQPYQWK